MSLGLIFQVFLIALAWAQVGQVTQIHGEQSAYLVRSQEKVNLKIGLELEQGDEIHSEGSVLNLLLHPTGQYRLSKNSTIKISQNLIQDLNDTEKSQSVIEFVKGVIRAQVLQDEKLEIDHKIKTKDVAFAVRGTEFEVSQSGDDYDLDVVEGEVEVSSPLVQTFVPEIVKANEGFRFNRKARSFKRRQFKLKNADHPRFLAREEIRKQRRENRLKRQKKREFGQPYTSSLERMKRREERKEERREERKEQRRERQQENRRTDRPQKKRQQR